MSNEVVLVELLTGFPKTHTKVKTEGLSASGNKTVTYEEVPRGLVMVGGQEWNDPEYVREILGFCAGNTYFTTSKGVEIRDLYFSQCRGTIVNPKTGYPYAWMKIGKAFSKMKQDPETEEMKVTVWIQIGLKQYKPTAVVVSEPEFALSEDDKVKAAQEAVDNV